MQKVATLLIIIKITRLQPAIMRAIFLAKPSKNENYVTKNITLTSKQLARNSGLWLYLSNFNSSTSHNMLHTHTIQAYYTAPVAWCEGEQ